MIKFYYVRGNKGKQKEDGIYNCKVIYKIWELRET